MVAKTQATHSTIGQRRKPQPGGQPGYVRVDTVHQGDHDGAMGVYYINAVDEMTQFQFVGSVQAISERFLLPMLEGLIKAFPFVIQGIHADNGSEYINHRVAALLNKLRIGEFTKSRPRHCNDNPFNIPLPFTHFPTPPTAPSTSLSLQAHLRIGKDSRLLTARRRSNRRHPCSNSVIRYRFFVGYERGVRVDGSRLTL